MVSGTSEINDLLYRMSPEYMRVYEQGFNDGRDFAVSEMMSAVRKVTQTKAYTETSGTFEVKP